ncbi:hypothetical protein ACA910_016086 [Epithemia clementina (nom. ined.)]
MSSTLFRLFEAFSVRRARTLPSPNSWASRALWNRLLLTKDEEEGEQSNEDTSSPVGDNSAPSGSERLSSCTGNGTITVDPIHNKQNQEIRQEFLNDMRIRDAQGKSLRPTILVTARRSPNQNNPLVGVASSTAANTMDDLRVPSSPGSQDYIYLPQ